MRRHIAFWQREIDRRPVVIVWLLVWFVGAAMNAHMGYEVGGFGVEGTFFALMFFGFAAAGAYAASEQRFALGARRAGLLLLVGFQLVLGQMAGWQTLGLSLGKGAAELEHKAAERSTLDDRIKALRAERAAIGVPRPIGKIEADLDLELRRTSKRYPNGDGPEATKLKGELEAVKRAALIDDTLLPDLLKQQGKGPQVTDANAQYAVPAAMAARVMGWWHAEEVTVTPADVRWGWMVFLVFFLELVATLGPWLFQIGGHRRAAEPDDDDWLGEQVLPPQYRTPAIATTEENPPYQGPFPAAHSASGFAAQQQPIALQALPAGGNTNNFYVGAAEPRQHLPPRAAARLARAR